MESGKKPMSSSSSTYSIANELFGSTDSSSSTGVFGSIFAPPSKLTEGDLRAPEVSGKKKEPKDNNTKGREPCNYSSSIYYGGQDIYYSPPRSQSSTSQKKGGEADDPHAVSRGDWWQGSFYY